MSDTPKPASPLPWKVRGCKDHPDSRAPSTLNCVKLRDANGIRIESPGDWAYAEWAANNAPTLAARIERLEAALREASAQLRERDAWSQPMPHVRAAMIANALDEMVGDL
jgi:hypothetical protein